MCLIEKVCFCNVALTPSHGVDTLVKTAQDRQCKALRQLLLLSMSPVRELPVFALRRCGRDENEEELSTCDRRLL